METRRAILAATFITALIFMPFVNQAAMADYYPGLTFGINGGLLGIATDNYDIIYGSADIWMCGFESSLKLFKIGHSGRLYSVVQVYYFEKEGKTFGTYSIPCLWQHRIFNAGGRYCFSYRSNTRAWLGAGAAFIDVTESFSGSIDDVSESTTGFYIEFGAGYKLIPGLELTGNLKVDGASIPNHGGIGGIGNQNVNVSTVTIVAGLNFAI